MKWVYTILLVLVIILLFWTFNKKEGFESIQDKLQDRANPLAAITNPLQNPATQIGIPESLGTTLRNMSITAFNTTVTPTEPPISQLISNENSFLGMIQFCKDNGSGDNPFTNPTFNDNCGVCMSSGKLLTGETFTTPTGVVVYPQDKKTAIANQKTNGYAFPHAIASLNAASCEGASMGRKSAAVLAINEKDYTTFKNVAACKHSASFGEGTGCAMCLSEKAWTYIDPTVQGPSITMILWGLGIATVQVKGVQVGKASKLDDTTGISIPLGPVTEGTTIQVNVTQATGQVDAPYLYGVIQTTLSSGILYSLGIGDFLETDSISNTFVRRGRTKLFNEVDKYLYKLMPGKNKNTMSIQGTLPLTFIEEDNIASNTCTGPFVTTQASYNEMVNDDPCTNPAGQGPGNYDDLCLQKVITTAGCSAAGKWFQDPSEVAGSKSLTEFKQWLTSLIPNINTDPYISMGCTGVDISTPCDAFVKNPRSIPDAKCLSYLYANKSQGSYIGSGYPTSKSSVKGDYNFCSESGKANPERPDGNALLTGIARNGYNGKFGIESIKDYLSDMYNKATNKNLNPFVDDSAGGNKNNLLNCLSLIVSPPPPPPIVPPPPPPPPPPSAACTMGPSQGKFIRDTSGFIGWNPTGTTVINPVGSCATGTCPGKPISACGNFTQLTHDQFKTYTHCPNYFDCSMIAAEPACKPLIRNNTNINTSIPLVNGRRGDANFPGVSDIQSCIAAARKKFPTGPIGVTTNPANNSQCWAVPMKSSGPGITTAAGWQSAFVDDSPNCATQPPPQVASPPPPAEKPSCPIVSGKPVHVCGPLGGTIWSRPNGFLRISLYEFSFPTNPGSFWVYGTPNSQNGAPAGRGPTVSKMYNNTSGVPIKTTIFCSFDDAGTVIMNGQRVLDQRGTVASTSYTLQPGCTRVDLSCWNDNGPAGLLFIMLDSNKNVLLQTNSSWTITT